MKLPSFAAAQYHFTYYICKAWKLHLLHPQSLEASPTISAKLGSFTYYSCRYAFLYMKIGFWHTSQHFLIYTPKTQHVTECMPVFRHTLGIHWHTLGIHQPVHQQEMLGSYEWLSLTVFCFLPRNTLFLKWKQKISAHETFKMDPLTSPSRSDNKNNKV